MADLRLEGVEKRFGDTVAADGIHLRVEEGELCVLLGPSGCGKSTLLRLVAGLERVDGGAIHIGGRDVTRLAPARRDVAMVFQSYALYPHMTVAENLAFALRRRPKGEVAERVAATAGLLGIAELLGRRPAQLSGGQRQRVAIGRALVREPALFLLDEPLSNLDAELRVRMRLEIASLQRRLGTTTVHVTHDQQEALTLAHRVVLLNRGRVEQSGAPLDLYHHPRNRFVAGFIGSPAMNFLEGTLGRAERGRARVRLAHGGEASAAVDAGAARPGAPVTLGIRPENLVLEATGSGAEVLAVEHLGDHSLVYARWEDGGPEPLVARVPGDTPLRPGDPVAPELPAAHGHLFAADGLAFPRVRA